MVFHTPNTRGTSRFTRRYGRASAPSTGSQIRPIRPQLETLEARLLLAGELGFAAQDPILVHSSPYGPIIAELGRQGNFADASDGKDVGLSWYQDASSSSAGQGFPSKMHSSAPAMMAIYNEADPTQSRQVKILDYASNFSGPAFTSYSLTKLQGPPPVPLPTVRFEGSLATPQDSMILRIPIGPSIDSLRLGVASHDRSPWGNLPIFDGIALYDGLGRKLSEASTRWDTDHLPTPSLLVSLANIPEGSQLVLRISAVAAASLSQSPANGQGLAGLDYASSGLNSLNANTQTSFVLTVQEFERADSASSASAGVDTSAGEPGGDDVQSPAELRSDPETSWTAEGDVSDSESQILVSGAGTSPSPSTADVRVPTGPLIARGSSPLGGILASAATDDDPTPVIERFDGILMAFLDGLDADDDYLSDQAHLDDGGARAISLDQFVEGIVLAGTTPGNLPLVVTQATGIPDDAQSAAFLASLPSSTTAPAENPIATQLELDLAALEEMGEILTKPRVASWAAAAFGVTLGLTLTSVPHLSDLLNRFRKVMPRRSRRQARPGGSQSKTP